MTRAESLVVECARQLVAKYDPELVEAPWDFRTTLMALGLAIKALDRAEAGRLRDADMGDECRCPDHRHS